MVGTWCRPASPYGMLQLPLFNWVYVASYALGVASSLVLILSGWVSAWSCTTPVGFDRMLLCLFVTGSRLWFSFLRVVSCLCHLNSTPRTIAQPVLLRSRTGNSLSLGRRVVPLCPLRFQLLHGQVELAR